MPLQEIRLLALLQALWLVACGTRDSQSWDSWVDDSPHESVFVTVNGVRLNYLDWGGTGGALLFLTGLGDSPHAFDGLAPEFTERFRVFALARRGQGRSEKPTSGYDNAVLVEDIRELLDRLGIEQVALVGWSMAGNELTGFAARYPHRVTRLVYLDAAYDYSGFAEIVESHPLRDKFWPTSEDLRSLDVFRQWVMDGWAKGLSWSDAMEAQLRDIVEIQPDGSVNFVMGDSVQGALFASAFSYEPEFTKVLAPALAIYAFWPLDAYVDAETDPTVRTAAQRWLENQLYPWQRQNVERFKGEMVNARVVEMPATHHWCFEHKPDEVLRHMRAFLFN